MSGTPVRVAVQLGAATARLAAAGSDGEPWLVAEVTAPGTTVASLLAELAPGPAEELVLVHPATWPASRAARWAGECGGLAGRVWAVPAPLAAAGRGEVAVLDVGHAAAEATLLGRDGRVLSVRARPVGGAALDAVVVELLGRSPTDPSAHTDARRVREALSLLPTVEAWTPQPVEVLASEARAVLTRPLLGAVDALREVLRGAGPTPVLLVGGVARTPLLAQLVDEAGIADVTVAPRPDAVAVLGALTLPVIRAGAPTRGSSGSPAPARRPCPGPRAEPVDLQRSAPEVRDVPVPSPVRRLPPLPPRTRRPVRTALLAAAAVGLVAGLLGLGTLLPAADPAVAVQAGVLVQYGYRLDIPPGWEHSGGLPERRRVLLTPVAAPEGSDLIAVERTPLGYDADAEPERAQAELRAEFAAAAAAGSTLSDYRVEGVGRATATYRQQDVGAGSVVDWFVLLDGDAQLSVGCRYTAAGSTVVRPACAVVVASVRRA